MCSSGLWPSGSPFWLSGNRAEAQGGAAVQMPPRLPLHQRRHRAGRVLFGRTVLDHPKQRQRGRILDCCAGGLRGGSRRRCPRGAGSSAGSRCKGFP